MIFDWTTMLETAISNLEPLHREILRRTLELPGKRRRIYYSEALQVWKLDRDEFDLQRNSAYEALRIYLLRNGVTGVDDLIVDSCSVGSPIDLPDIQSPKI
jgi:hypothetical protein